MDGRVPEHRDSHASSSHELSLGPHEEYGFGLTLLILTSRKTEIARSARGPTKITRAPCRRCIGRVVPRAENFGDLITEDHKVLSEGCESRNNHRYAVVVQDLATQWIESYPCKTKNFSGNTKELAKVLGAEWEA